MMPHRRCIYNIRLHRNRPKSKMKGRCQRAEGHAVKHRHTNPRWCHVPSERHCLWQLNTTPPALPVARTGWAGHSHVEPSRFASATTPVPWPLVIAKERLAHRFQARRRLLLRLLLRLWYVAGGNGLSSVFASRGRPLLDLQQSI